MVRVWLILVLSIGAFGSTITYNYTGTPFDRCNGTLLGSGNCPGPAVFMSDHNTASFSFSAALAGNLSAADEKSSPNLIGWTTSDASGLATLSSKDVNATSRLKQLMFSTNASGAITGWEIDVSDLVHNVSGNEIGMVNPTIIGGGTGLPLADNSGRICATLACVAA